MEDRLQVVEEEYRWKWVVIKGVPILETIQYPYCGGRYTSQHKNDKIVLNVIHIYAHTYRTSTSAK